MGNNVIDRRTTNCMMILVVLSFLLWYVPASFFNIFACDDFWFGTNVRLNGFWANQSFYWHNWEGSYTHTFLASLPHVLCFPKAPFICNILSLISLFLSLTYFIKSFSENSSTESALRALFLTSLAYTFTLGESEIRFWVCANLTYVVEISCVVFLIAVYHRMRSKPRAIYLVLLFLFVAIIGGCKITFIFLSFSCLILHDIIYQHHPDKLTLIVLFLLTVFTLINILAPGNYIRLEEETSRIPGECDMTMIESIFYRIVKILPWLAISFLSLPASFDYLKIPASNKKIVSALVLFCTFVYVGESIIMYICFNDPGPIRVYFQAEIIILLIVSGVIGYFFHYSSHRVLKRVFCITTSLIIIFFNITLLFKVPGSIEYSRASCARDLIVKNAPKEGTIKLPELPESYLLLSYFVNETVWLENIYLPYFDCNCKVEIIKSSD